MFSYKYTGRNTYALRNLQKREVLLNLVLTFDSMGIMNTLILRTFSKSLDYLENPYLELDDPYLDWTDREMDYFERSIAKSPKLKKFRLKPTQYNG